LSSAARRTSSAAATPSGNWRTIWPYRKEVADKPEQIQDKILEAKLGKFYKQVCLLNQPYVRDDKMTVQDVVTDVIGVCGENIVVRRFVRMELGGK